MNRLLRIATLSIALVVALVGFGQMAQAAPVAPAKPAVAATETAVGKDVILVQRRRGGRGFRRGARRGFRRGFRRGARRGFRRGYRRGRRFRRGIYIGIGPGYYGYRRVGRCAYLRRRAVRSGSRYWWRRYRSCVRRYY